MRSIVHLHCGDCAAEQAKKASLPGQPLVWIELLHEGPLPDRPFGSDEFLKPRAETLSASTGGAISAEACLRRLKRQDGELAQAAASVDELILWFDACLFDQTILLRHLVWLSTLERRPAKLSLVCIGEFPGKPAFHGLGELSPEELASLFPARAPVSESMTRDANAIWRALLSKQQAELFSLARKEFEGLPFMGDALREYLRQIPSVKNGLPALDERLLEALQDGALDPVELFKRVAAKTKRPYFGDTTLFRHANALAAKGKPLVAIEGPGKLPVWDVAKSRLSDYRLSLTDFGRMALAGDFDDVAENGIDLALGAFYFEGRSCLRFDEKSFSTAWK